MVVAGVICRSIKRIESKRIGPSDGRYIHRENNAEAGEEWTDIFAELAAEKDVAEGLGLNLTGPVNPAPTETIEVENGNEND
jgi:hypothetical protein